MVTIYILVALFSSAVAIIAPIFVTVLVEFPFIILGKVCDNKRFFIALNVLTNFIFNSINVIFYILSHIFFSLSEVRFGWCILAEGIIIPLVEARMYMKISDSSRIRIYILTYLANIASCALGIIALGFRFI